MFRNKSQLRQMAVHNDHSLYQQPDLIHLDRFDPFQKSTKVSETNMNLNVGVSTVKKRDHKLIKLVGDRQRNISELVEGFGCVCGCRVEFKNVVVLLMDKIYKLREERNGLKNELAFFSHTPRDKDEQKVYKDVGVETYNLQELKENIIKPCSQYTQEKILELEHINTDQMNDYFNLNDKLLLTLSKRSETNLLQTSSIQSQIENSSLSIEMPQIHTQDNVLREHCSNTSQNKMQDICRLLKHKSINLNTLEEFIEKVHCRNQLGKYDENKRKRELF